MLGTLIALHRLWVFYSHSLLGSGHYKSTTYVIACRGYYLQSGFFCFIPFLPIVSITVSMSGFTGLQCIGAWAVILLQIVMVSPATHLEKNHKSQSRTNKSQLKKQTNKQTRSPKLKILEPFGKQTVKQETYTKTFYCTFHKHANSKVQKPPSQLCFSLPSIIITITSNEP